VAGIVTKNGVSTVDRWPVITRRQAGSLGLGALAAALSGCSNSDAATSRAVDGGVVEEFPRVERDPFAGVSGGTIQGGRVDSSDFPDHVLVINVWGSWCVPCREEAPDLSRL